MLRSRSRIHLGEGAIFTFRTIRAVYRGTRSAAGVSTSSRSVSDAVGAALHLRLVESQGLADRWRPPPGPGR